MLRWPETKMHYNAREWALFEEQARFNIRPPFAALAVDTGHFDWAADPHNDRTWRLYFHSMYWLNAVLWGLDHDKYNAEKQAGVLGFLKHATLSFCDYFLGLGEVVPDSVWDDHSAAYRLSYLALLFQRYIGDDLQAEEREKLYRVVDIHLTRVGEFIESEKWDHSNHRLFQIEGYLDAHLAFYPKSEKSSAALAYVADVFSGYVTENISLKDGTSKEHATFYHAFLMGRINETQKYLTRNGAAFDIDFDALFKKMNHFLWVISPDAYTLPGIGDTKHNMRYDRKHVQDFCTAEYDSGAMEYVLSNGAAGVAPPPLTAFSDDGYYVFRTNNIKENELFSVFLEKKYIGPHGHVDGSSFITYYDKEPVFADAGGPFQYGNKLRYRYFQKQVAHNTVLVGKSRDYHTEVRDQQSRKNLSLVEAVADMGGGITWSRIFGHLFDDLIVIIDYVAGAGERQDIRQHFLLSPQMSVNTQADGSHYLMGDRVAARMTSLQRTAIEDTGGGTTSPEASRRQENQMLRPLPRENAFMQGLAGCVTAADTKFSTCSTLNVPLTSGIPTVTLVSFKRKYSFDFFDVGDRSRFIAVNPAQGVMLFDVVYEPTASGLNTKILADI